MIIGWWYAQLAVAWYILKKPRKEIDQPDAKVDDTILSLQYNYAALIKAIRTGLNLRKYVVTICIHDLFNIFLYEFFFVDLARESVYI